MADSVIGLLLAMFGSQGNCLADRRESIRPMNAMMRVRLKADGRIVEILADGTERAIAGAAVADAAIAGVTEVANPRTGGQGRDAVYAKGIRARAKLTQAEFAARIGRASCRERVFSSV